MRILLAADGSMPALRSAELLAAMLGPIQAEVIAVHILSYDKYPHSLVGGELSDKAEREAVVAKEVAEATDGIVKALTEAGHTVGVEHRFGSPADELVEAIAESQPDLVVMGRRGLKGPARWVGSVSEHVLHHTKLPVLLA